jgi:GTP-binding protein HflX
MWKHLERQAGGIGTRGPGETQLETDRRLVRERIALLKRELAGVERERETQRNRRRREFRAAIVGYTNAGKSTLFNRLTRAGVLVENRLFATLDSTTRRLVAPDRTVVLVTDTVGFIRKLPHHLVASFHSTLVEAIEADLLLHVVDASDPLFRRRMTAVEQVLEKIMSEPRPTTLVFNKADRWEVRRRPAGRVPRKLRRLGPHRRGIRWAGGLFGWPHRPREINPATSPGR